MHIRRRKYIYRHVFTIVFFTFLREYVLAADNFFPKLHGIHKRMKRQDLSRIFGEDNINKIPQYEIIKPRLQIQYSKKRRKRDTLLSHEHLKDFNVNVDAFRKNFHFNLSLNENLLSPNFKLELKKQKKSIVKRTIENCYYHGKLYKDRNSLAAISTCNGLSGLFTSDNHDYFIEPVPNYLHNEEYESYFDKPHIVYRRSIFDKSQGNLKNRYQQLWSEEANKMKRNVCATKHDPHIRFERSSDDITNLVKADNSEKYIESLVVVDQKMVNYHGEDAATQFALAVLNIVASFLRDGSIGANLIILVVVKLELHTVDIPGLVINHHARNTLESFGTWASKASDQDDRSDDHYDYAILLTRYNICADDRQPCDTLGLTQVGGMCNWPDSASINQDNGLPLAYTITHSIGHSLGMNHDGDESSFICPDNTYLMSTSPPDDWKDTRNIWSRCSRNYLRQFLKKPQSHCLNDLPVKARSVDYDKLDNKPGILYDINKQCAMQFGTGSKVCNKEKTENVCEKLACTDPSNSDKCFRSSYPAADGTTCALNKWCYRGKCLSVGQTTAIDGGWSSWSDDFSDCSRSCGGGVQYRFRQCSHPKPSNGGKYCEGDARRYRLCNTKACAVGLVSHRHIQCSKLDNRLFGERKFTWEFKPSKIDSCKLGCFIANTGHGYDFGNVEDGTNCDQMDGSVIADKCINGECVPVGCDGILGSEKKFDRCGICNGDGSTCATGSERSEIPDSNPNSGGIVDAIRALKTMGFNMGSLYGKSELTLDNKRSGIPGKDSNPEFGWARVKSGCTVSCGGGTETVTAECRRQDDGSPVNDDKCDKSLKPPVQHFPCKEDACPPVWQTSYWGDCTHTCNGGLKKRNVRCVQKSGTGIEYDVDGSLCAGSRPSDTEGCNKEPCPSEWIAQPFGECSTICGPGIQVRDVLCQKTLKDGTLLTEKENDCRKETKPPVEQKCNVHNPCPGDDGCGGIYTDDKGNFTSPQYPNNYPNNMECVHIIQVQDGKAIQLDFDSMKIVAADEKDCRNDFVKVMDGDCVSRLGESKFCGRTIPPPFISTTNRLCVKFFSDDSQNDEGFVAKYHSIDKPQQLQDVCGANITAPAGLISSPNYPEYYPPNEDCNITITTDEKPIKINFHAFDVGTDDCSNDYVFLSGGEESKKYCGQKVPPVYTSTSNLVFLRFVSTNHPANMKAGFVATYTSGPASDVEQSKPQEESNSKQDSKSSDTKNSNKLKNNFINNSQATPPQQQAQNIATGPSNPQMLPQQGYPQPFMQPVAPQAVTPMVSAADSRSSVANDNTSKRNGSLDEAEYSEYKKDIVQKPENILQNQNTDKFWLANNINGQQNSQATPIGGQVTPISNTFMTPESNSDGTMMQVESHPLEHQLQASITTGDNVENIPDTRATEATINNVNYDMKPTTNEMPKVSFVNVADTSDEIAKDVQLSSASTTNHKELSEKEKLFENAMKDDTPSWVPEPQLISDDIRTEEQPIKKPDDVIEKRSNITKPTIRHKVPATNIISLPNFMPNEKKQALPIQIHPVTSEHETEAEKISVSNAVATKPLIQQTSDNQKNAIHKDPVNRKANLKVSTNQKASINPVNQNTNIVNPSNQLALLNVADNQDEYYRGGCPVPKELKCIRVLLSYPCQHDAHCKPDFLCCRTACEYGVKMCTPRVTEHCPLRDPFYFPHIPCNNSRECPYGSPCCVDMTNRKYCRHMISSRWQQ